MRNVARMRLAERTDVDARRIRALVRDMGQPSAERLLGRAVDEIAERLRMVERAAAAGDMRAVVRAARQLAPIAIAVGLTGVAKVSDSVIATAEAGDSAGLGATLARLARLSDGSVRAIGEAWAARI